MITGWHERTKNFSFSWNPVAKQLEQKLWMMPNFWDFSHWFKLSFQCSLARNSTHRTSIEFTIYTPTRCPHVTTHSVENKANACCQLSWNAYDNRQLIFSRCILNRFDFYAQTNSDRSTNGQVVWSIKLPTQMSIFYQFVCLKLYTTQPSQSVMHIWCIQLL